ncbi:helix-turn-helix domain-containing protein [Kitasatospora aureofaciens]|uniref:helix-turn-helix domain-containing protein n=1 Tax=Kitasatospora aureofaciens TaxID=1894 RepID=UPI001C478E14|nr:helix-turn-helix domain-containing protein [Kitasatospora aureofaciens]
MSRFDAARARALRLNSGVGFEDLALLAGVSPNTIRNALEGKHNPWPRVAAAIARALGVPAAELSLASGPLTLRDIRHRLGLAQKDIATRVGVCRQMVSRVERGVGGVGAPEHWARAYGLTLKQWLRAHQASQKSALKRVEERIKNTTGGK